MPAPAVERRAKRQIRDERRPRHGQAGRAAGDRVGAHGAAHMRPSAGRRQINRRHRTAGPTTGHRRTRHRCGEPSPKARTQRPLPVQGNAQPSRVGIERQPRVGQAKHQVGQAERRGGLRIAELVQFAQAQHAVVQRAAHPHAARTHRGDLRRQAGKGDVHLDPAGGQVRPGGIAEHDILDALGAESDIDEVVIRLNPAPVEFAADEILGNRGTLRPQRDQHQRQRAAAHGQPASPRPADRVFAAVVFHSLANPGLQRRPRP
jgi:hypothetical protein